MEYIEQLTLKNDSQLADMMNKQWNDFMFGSQVANPWFAITISSGSVGYPAGDAIHSGVALYSSHTTNNDSGASFRIHTGSILLSGGEKTTIIFKTATQLTNILRKMGFHTAIDAAEPTDGVYCLVSSGVLSGKTANNSVVSTTSTNYTLESSTWYRLVIQLDASASKATFTLYKNNSNIILWTDQLTSNIPKTRTVGHGDICTLSTATGSSITLGYIDYMDIILPNRRVV